MRENRVGVVHLERQESKRGERKSARGGQEKKLERGGEVVGEGRRGLGSELTSHVLRSIFFYSGRQNRKKREERSLQEKGKIEEKKQQEERKGKEGESRTRKNQIQLVCFRSSFVQHLRNK